MSTDERAFQSTDVVNTDLRELWALVADAGGFASAPVTAALCDEPTVAARRGLWALARAGALTERYGVFSCTPVAWEGEVQRGEVGAAAWERVTRWHLATAFAAAGVLRCQALPGGEVIEPDPARPVPKFDGAPGVLDWYRYAHDELLETIERACTLGDDGQGWRLALLDAQIAIVAGPHPDWEHPLDLATRAASRTGEPGAVAMIAEYRGKHALHFGRYAQALAAHEESLALREQAGDLPGQMRSCNALALVHLRTDAAAADVHFNRALALADQLDDAYFRALIRANLASALCAQGHYVPARDLLVKAIAYLRDAGPDYYLAGALQTMARTFRREGAVEPALGWAKQAVELAMKASLPLFLAGPLVEYAEAVLAYGDPRSALDAFDEARAIHAVYGDTVRAGLLAERITQISRPA